MPPPSINVNPRPKTFNVKNKTKENKRNISNNNIKRKKPKYNQSTVSTAKRLASLFWYLIA